MVNADDLKSSGPRPCRFESCSGHHRRSSLPECSVTYARLNPVGRARGPGCHRSPAAPRAHRDRAASFAGSSAPGDRFRSGRSLWGLGRSGEFAGTDPHRPRGSALAASPRFGRCGLRRATVGSIASLRCRRARPRSLKVPGGFIGRSSILGVDQAIQVRTESLLRRRMRRARCRSRSPASKSPAMGKRFFGDWLSKAIPKRASSSRPVGAPKSEGWVVCLDHPM